MLLMKNIPFSAPQLLPQAVVDGKSVDATFGLAVVFVVVTDVGREYETNGSDEWNSVVVKADSVKVKYLEVNVFDVTDERTSERRFLESFIFVELMLGDNVEAFILVDSFDESVGFKSETTDTCSCDEVNLCDNVEVWMLGRSSPDRTLVGLVFGGKCEAIDLGEVVDTSMCFCNEVDVCDVTNTCSCDEVNLCDNVEVWMLGRSSPDRTLVGRVFVGTCEAIDQGEVVDADMCFCNEVDVCDATNTSSCDEVNLCDNVEVWMLGRSSPDRPLVGLVCGGKCEAIDQGEVVDADMCFCNEVDVCDATNTSSCDEVNLCDNVEVWMLGRSSPDRPLVGLVCGGKCEAIDLGEVVDTDMCFCHEVDFCDVTEQLFERAPIEEFLAIERVTGDVEVVIIKKLLGVVIT